MQSAFIAMVSWSFFCVAAQAGGEPSRKEIAARLERLLDPTSDLDLRGFATAPKRRPGPRSVEEPDVPLLRVDIDPPALPHPESRPLAPRLSPEPVPLSYYHVAAEVPQSPRLPVGPLAWQPGVDVLMPVSPPVFGRYVADRVSLADASLEISVEQTRVPQNPVRAGEVPFTPVNLPNPFENADVVRLRQAWPDELQPPPFGR